jgi:1,4-dihydroxy-6-naphthoate synthase
LTPYSSTAKRALSHALQGKLQESLQSPTGGAVTAGAPPERSTAWMANAEPPTVPDAVRERTVDCGLIIHEAQLTYDRCGFHKIVDLGRWWKSKYNLPLPLGCNVLQRSLAPGIQKECCRMMRDSIQYALDNHDESLSYAMQFARDMDHRMAEKFVGMYVNHYTVDCGDIVPIAAQKLLDMGFEAGLVPRRVEFEFVR